VVNKRQKVKKVSGDRSRKLQASLAWQQFSRDSDEVRGGAEGCGFVCVAIVTGLG